jgi:CheY-like chemotaxis protein
VPGRGATFTAYLPPTSPSREVPRVVEASSPNRRRILLMDDDPVVREVVGRIVMSLGCEVASARDADEAVDAWRRQLEQGSRFDAAFIDLTVPGGKGGKVAAREILELDPGARLIVMSGYCNDPVMAEYRAHGFAGVLPKPVRVADLRGILQRVLGAT